MRFPDFQMRSLHAYQITLTSRIPRYGRLRNPCVAQ